MWQLLSQTQSGILPTRGSLMLDIVFCAMFLVVPIMFWSIRLVKQGQYKLHKQVQIATALVLLTAIVAFEIDIRLHGWIHLTTESPFEAATIKRFLYVHLAFAIPTPLIWIVVIVKALRRFPKPPQPNSYSSQHKKLGWIAVCGMTMTGLTGAVFYYVAFIASH
ncbi:MAG: DUF420 domain-containing protein [Planctomycetota bacterium]|nr:DUF420 domain-containing protein [Planctomycetota bacterium]